MTIQAISQNKVTDSTRLDYDSLLNDVLSIANQANDPSSSPEAIAKNLSSSYYQMIDMSVTGMSTRSGDVKTTFDNLQAALANVIHYQGSNLKEAIGGTSIDSVVSRASAAINASSTLTETLRPAIQDQVYYHYSKAGEADLNNQLGQLGDAMNDLNEVLRYVNKIDLALSINPRNDSGDSYVNAEGLLEDGFLTSKEYTNIAGTNMNANLLIQDALDNLTALRTGFDESSTVYKSLVEVQKGFDSASTFKEAWEDNSLRRQINDLLTNLSSQSDVEKQNLRKAMFIYQEFVKSSGSILDRIFEAVRSIASRIAR